MDTKKLQATISMTEQIIKGNDELELYLMLLGEEVIKHNHPPKEIWSMGFGTGYARALYDVIEGKLNLQLFQPERR